MKKIFLFLFISTILSNVNRFHAQDCDSFSLDLEVVSFCSFDPCENPTVNYPVSIYSNGQTIDYACQSVIWENGWQSSSMSLNYDELPTWAIVCDTLSGCCDTIVYNFDCGEIIPDCNEQPYIEPYWAFCDSYTLCDNDSWPVLVYNEDGPLLLEDNYTFIWSNETTSNVIYGVTANNEISVEVAYPDGCIYTVEYMEVCDETNVECDDQPYIEPFWSACDSYTLCDNDSWPVLAVDHSGSALLLIDQYSMVWNDESTSDVLYGVAPGDEISVTVTYPDGCIYTFEYMEDCEGVSPQFVSIEEQGDIEFSFYPNPASNQLILETNIISDASVKIFDLTGKKLFNSKLTSSVLNISLKEFSNGIYFIQLTSDNDRITKRFEVSK